MMTKQAVKRSKSKFFTKDKYVGTTPAVESEFKIVLGKLQGRGNLQLLDQRTMSQEALINASWLWMKHVIETDGVATLERHLHPAFGQLSVMVAEEMRARGR